MTLRTRTDRTLIRSTHRSERFVLVELDVPVPPTTQRRRESVNLAFVLDRSGSMGGRKLDLAKEAVRVAIDRLLPDDRFAVVTYDDRVDVVVGSTAASAEAKRNALTRLASIDARGSTNLGEGWLRGAEQVAAHAAQVAGGTGPTGGVNRVLLLTDGLANQGITDPVELAHHAGELRARGVTTSTFGVGEDFDETLLQALADTGGGHFYFIERPEQIMDLIASEVGELLEIVAREATIEVTAPDGMTVRPLSPYRLEVRANRSILLLGDLVAGQRVEALIGIKFGYGPIGSEVGVLIAATDRDGVLAAAGAYPVTIGWRYADDPTNDHQPRDRSVDRRVAAFFAARALQEAVKLNRLGDYQEAAKEIHGVAEKIAWYADDDPELLQTLATLRAEQSAVERPMPEMARKQYHAAASYTLRSREPDGKARR